MRNLVVKGMVIVGIVVMTIVGVNGFLNFVGGRDLKKVEQMVNEFNELHEDDVLKATYEYDFKTDNYVIGVHSYDEDGNMYGNGNRYNNVEEFIREEF